MKKCEIDIAIRDHIFNFPDNTANAPNAGYTDIGAAASWARDSINYCFESGIMTGTSTTPLRFSPKDAFTRQQSIATFDRMG